MTDREFEVMDELYFVISYEQLKSEISLDETEMRSVLKSLYSKKWIRVLKTEERDVEEEEIDWNQGMQDYYYLASKQGLFAHNSA